MTSRARPEPRAATSSWPQEICRDPVSERARLFVLNLRRALAGTTLREAAAATGVDHTTLSRILDGHVWPDGYTVARLEVRLERNLWPAWTG